MDSVRTASVPPGYPAIDFDRATRIATKGVPLPGHFECSLDSVKQRERHENASLTPDAIAHVRKKVYERGKAILPHTFPAFHLGLHPGSIPSSHHVDCLQRPTG